MIHLITIDLEKAFEQEGLDSSLAFVVPCENPDADFQCNGAKAAAGKLRQNPKEMAHRIYRIRLSFLI
jgi:arginyl-tRNA synthetase